MDTYIVTAYCLCDDLLKSMNHRDDPQGCISDAEVMTIALVAARFFGGNQALSNLMLHEQRYIKFHLSRSRYCRRLKKIHKYYEALFAVLGDYFKTQNTQQTYVVDSMPVAVCDNYRSLRCRIYRDKRYKGYVASKKRYIFGIKIHLLTTGKGEPVEFTLTAASEHDLTGLYALPCYLPKGAILYGDKAYVQQVVEETFKEYGIDYAPIRRSNAKVQDEPAIRYLKSIRRKCVETTNSLIERIMPKHIHAVTKEGFETKVALFVIAATINFLTLLR
jgi:hypothetical protein